VQSHTKQARSEPREAARAVLAASKNSQAAARDGREKAVAGQRLGERHAQLESTPQASNRGPGRHLSVQVQGARRGAECLDGVIRKPWEACRENVDDVVRG